MGSPPFALALSMIYYMIVAKKAHRQKEFFHA